MLRTLDKVEDMRLATLEAGVEWDFETYGEYLDAVARRGTVINFGGYVGHTPVRLYVMGDDAYERKATDDEIIRMKQVVADSLNGGALGFSSDRGGFHIGDGGRPVPSIMASQEETEALMRVTGEINRGMIHIAPGENYEWVYDFQKSLGRTITWSSILTYPPEWKSRAPFKGKLDRHAEGRRDGADVWVQVTCRPIVQQILMNEPTPFYQLPAFADLVATPMADRPTLYRDPSWRKRVYDEFESSKWINPGWETFTVSDSQAHPELEGRSLASIARDRGCTPFDVLADVALDDNLMARFEVTFANNDEAGITMLVQSEGCIMGLSDAGAHISQICDAVMPTDFLSSWVRDREVMSIERGVRKLTGEIADVIGVDRGYLRVGSPADIVVLDLEQLSTGPLTPGARHARGRRAPRGRRPDGYRRGARQRRPDPPRRQADRPLARRTAGRGVAQRGREGALMKVGVSLFMQNYTDWLRFEGIEARRRGHAPSPSPIRRSTKKTCGWARWSSHSASIRCGASSTTSRRTRWCPTCLKLLSYFAGCTERIEMGTMVIVLPWHDPIRVAEGIATLDNMLSGRRLSIGFGRGLGRREFGALRVPMEESRERFLESLDIVKTALSDEWFSYDGQFTNIPRTTLRPQPRSTGAELIENMYCAWGSPQTIPIAAQTGLKALFIPQTTWDDYAVQMAKFRDLRAQAGFAPAHPTIALLGLLREGRARSGGRGAAVHPAIRRQRAPSLRDRQHALRDDQGVRALRGREQGASRGR